MFKKDYVHYFYFLIRLLANHAIGFTFRKIHAKGYKAITYKKPALFVANHQNTFMDGLVMVQTAWHTQPNILVRADIFKSKLAAFALNLIRLLPIYRKRDGMSSIQQNDAVFEKCFKIFERNSTLALFPEGNHNMARRLRPLQKGAARIAFQAEAKHDFQLGLTVVPVGLHYEKHTEPWNDLYVNYGEPISLAEFKEAYEENPNKAMKEFTDTIRERISKEMVDIQWVAEYDFMEDVRTLMKPELSTLKEYSESPIYAENQIIKATERSLQGDESTLKAFKEKLTTYIKSINNAGLDLNYATHKHSIISLLARTFGLLIGSPFWLIATIVNSLPFWIIEKKVISGVKDKTWHLSLRTGISMFLIPFFYLLLFFAAYFIGHSWELAGIISLSLPLCSIVQFEINRLFRIWKDNLKLIKDKSTAKKLSSQRKDLVQQVKSWL